MTTLMTAGVVHGGVMAAIHAASFPPGERWGADAMEAQLGLPGTFAVLALSPGDAPCGFVLARIAADEAEILTLAVLPTQRRQGVAGLLLQAAEACAEASGASSMFLEVAAPNEAARRLYAGRGYHQVGLRRGYYAGGADALVLQRRLGRYRWAFAQPGDEIAR
jgi:[ribosomal protein S18]-alanine N-acetyltransferase